MRDKKSKPPATELDQQAIEQKVDAMMSVESKPATANAAKAAQPSVLAVSGPVEDQTTAPQLPTQLLKTIGGSKPTKSTLKIIKNEPIEPAPDRAPIPETKTLEDDPLQDSDTDKAVDSIVADEADMQLAVADAVDRQKNAVPASKGPGLFHRFFTSPWTWLFIIGVAGVTYAWYH